LKTRNRNKSKIETKPPQEVEAPKIEAIMILEGVQLGLEAQKDRIDSVIFLLKRYLEPTKAREKNYIS
jgi:hypothetical protein